MPTFQIFKQAQKVCFYGNWQIEIDYRAIRVLKKKRPGVSWMDETTVFIFNLSNVILSFWTLHIGKGLKKKAWIVINLPIQTIWGVPIHMKYPTIIPLWGRTIKKEPYNKGHDEILSQIYTRFSHLGKHQSKAITRLNSLVVDQAGSGLISLVQKPVLPLPSSLLNNLLVS